MRSTLAHLFTPQHSNNHRPKLIHPEGFFVLTTMALVFHVLLRSASLSPLGNVLGYASSITASGVLDQINAKRTESGLQPLSMNSQLNAAAVAKATNMFEQQYWAHVSPTGTQPWSFIKNAGYKYSVAGENLAKDFGDTGSMVEAWMASATHKANIVNSKYVDTGIAVVDGQLQGVETTLVVQMFGAPSVRVATVPKQTKPVTAQAQIPAVAPAPAKTQTGQSPTQPQQTAQQPTQPVKVGQGATLLRPPEVLSEITTATPYFSPILLSKAFFLSMMFLLIAILIYDMIVAQKKNLIRFAGKNLAHISLLIAVSIIIMAVKGGSLI